MPLIQCGHAAVKHDKIILSCHGLAIYAEEAILHRAANKINGITANTISKTEVRDQYTYEIILSEDGYGLLE